MLANNEPIGSELVAISFNDDQSSRQFLDEHADDMTEQDIEKEIKLGTAQKVCSHF
jgi:hypothetical protein